MKEFDTEVVVETRTVPDDRWKTEADLITALKAGDAQAFSALVETLHAPLVRMASVYVHAAMAEDAVQDAWLSVVRSIGKFEGRRASARGSCASSSTVCAASRGVSSIRCRTRRPGPKPTCGRRLIRIEWPILNSEHTTGVMCLAGGTFYPSSG